MEYYVFCCDICNKAFPNSISYQVHLLSERHQKKLSATPKINNSNGDATSNGDTANGSILSGLEVPYNMRTKIMENSILCEICNKRCSGIVPYQQHIESRKHKKQLEKKKLYETLNVLRNSEANENSLVVTSMENSKTNQNNSPSSFDYCHSCKKAFSSIISYTEHVNSAGHKREIDLANSLHSIISENSDSAKPLCSSVKDESLFFICEDCELSFSDPGPYHCHMVSYDHLKRIESNQILEKQSVPLEVNSEHSNDIHNSSKGLIANLTSITLNESNYKCTDCKKVFSGLIPYSQHMDSEVHLKCITKKKLLEKLSNENNHTPLNSDKDNSASQKGSLSTSNKYTNDDDDVSVIGINMMCTVCNVSLSGPESTIQHLSGKKHMKAVQQKKNGIFAANNEVNDLSLGKPCEKLTSENDKSVSFQCSVETASDKKPCEKLTSENDKSVSFQCSVETASDKVVKSFKNELRCDQCIIEFDDVNSMINHLQSDEHHEENKSTTSLDFVIIDEPE